MNFRAHDQVIITRGVASGGVGGVTPSTVGDLVGKFRLDDLRPQTTECFAVT